MQFLYFFQEGSYGVEKFIQVKYVELNSSKIEYESGQTVIFENTSADFYPKIISMQNSQLLIAWGYPFFEEATAGKTIYELILFLVVSL